MAEFVTKATVSIVAPRLTSNMIHRLSKLRVIVQYLCWMFLPFVMSCCLQAKENDWSEPIPSYVIDLFESRSINYSGGRYQDADLAYRLFVPPLVEITEQYPLLVWASGYGERGNDNVGQLMHLDHLLDDPSNPEKFPFFVLAMQNPPDSGRWADSSGVPKPDEPATILVEILEQTIRDCPIDEDRIYLSGVSSGGTACWEIALRHPNKFAAIVPMASSGTPAPKDRLKLLTRVPIWAFHCTEDPSMPPTTVRSTVATLSEVGGRVHLTEIEEESHDCWTAAFRDYRVMEWMLSHSRKSNSGYLPGEVPWRWWHIAVVPVLSATVVGLFSLEKKRRTGLRSSERLA